MWQRLALGGFIVMFSLAAHADGMNTSSGNLPIGAGGVTVMSVGTDSTVAIKNATGAATATINGATGAATFAGPITTSALSVGGTTVQATDAGNLAAFTTMLSACAAAGGGSLKVGVDGRLQCITGTGSCQEYQNQPGHWGCGAMGDPLNTWVLTGAAASGNCTSGTAHILAYGKHANNANEPVAFECVVSLPPTTVATCSAQLRICQTGTHLVSTPSPGTACPGQTCVPDAPLICPDHIIACQTGTHSVTTAGTATTCLLQTCVADTILPAPTQCTYFRATCQGSAGFQYDQNIATIGANGCPSQVFCPGEAVPTPVTTGPYEIQ